MLGVNPDELLPCGFIALQACGDQAVFRFQDLSARWLPGLDRQPVFADCSEGYCRSCHRALSFIMSNAAFS